MSIVGSLIRKSVKRDTPLNILSFWYDGRFDLELAKTGHKFYGSQDTSCYPWPAYEFNHENIHIFNSLNEAGIVDYDLILFNNREVHGRFFNLVRNFHVPALIIDHDAAGVNAFVLSQIKKSTPFPSISTSQTTAQQFGGETIYYGIEQKVGQYDKDIDILICGDFHEQDYGFLVKLKGTFPSLKVVGRNKLPFSETVNSYEDYKNLFKRARIFLNIAPQRNIGYEVLWSLQYKTVIIGNAQPMYTELLNENNAILTENLDQAILEIRNLANNQGRYAKLMNHNTNLSKYGEEQFVNKWNEIFESYRYKAYIE